MNYIIPVEKVAGYRFPGIVVSVYETLSGEVRYDVEADNPDFAGMLHIFSETTLKARTEIAPSPPPPKDQRNEIADRVADAIMAEIPTISVREAKSAALAALHSIREPSEEMTAKAALCSGIAKSVPLIWTAVIDYALDPGKPFP